MDEMARKRPYSANDFADWFINMTDRSQGEVITPLMVQRLLFFAQAWHLANKGRPLFAEEFEAWATGPVIVSVFERFQHTAFECLPFIENARDITGDRLSLLESVHEEYGCYQARKLDELSQERGGPWEQARGGRAPEAACNTIISKEAMKRFYGAKIGKEWKEQRVQGQQRSG